MSDLPRFVTDYRKRVSLFLRREPTLDAAMARAVGGRDGRSVRSFDEMGDSERAILVGLGLKAGDYVIDVGAGSGRLAAALHRGGPQIKYLGTDVVPELLAYARERTGWRFELVTGLSIPEQDNVADFVVFFSVITHLSRSDSLTYLHDAKRVLKPGGRIVASYLDCRGLRPSFVARVLASQAAYLLGWGIKNVFASETGMRRFANELDMRVRFLGNPIGQSVCVFTKE